MGKLVNVEIVESTKFSMVGKLIVDEDGNSVKSPSIQKVKSPVVETTFQGSIFYKMSMAMLILACIIRVYHIFYVKFPLTDKAAPKSE